MKKHIEDIIIGISSICLIVIAIIDFLGFLDRYVWLKDRFGTFQILALGILLGAIVIDRAFRLTKIDNSLQNVLDNYFRGLSYFEDQKDVNRELILTVRNAKDILMVIGAKSSSSNYLEEIEAKASDPNLKHYRLITGDHITKEMREHLLQIISLNDRNCLIRWNYSEKYGSFVITDEDVFIGLPTSHSEKFLSLKFSNQKSCKIYSTYFMDAFAQGFDITEANQVDYLCEVNGSSIAKSKTEIIDELKSIAESGSARPPKRR